MPSDALIKIYYYDFWIKVSSTNEQYKGMNFEDLYSYFINVGFMEDNIILNDVSENYWIPGVVDVMINGTNMFLPGEFTPYSEAVISYCDVEGRIDITDCLSGCL